MREEQRQRHFLRVFPAVAEALWTRLCNVIEEELRRMREVFPQLFSQEIQVNRQNYSLGVGHTELFPQYFLCLAINIQEHELIVQQITKETPYTSSSGDEFTLILSLDEDTQMLRLRRDEETLSFEKLVELCLRPLVDLHPVNLVKIRG